MKNFFLALFFFVGILATNANVAATEMSTAATFSASDNIELVGEYTSEVDRDLIICSSGGIDVYVDGEYVGTYDCVIITY